MAQHPVKMRKSTSGSGTSHGTSHLTKNFSRPGTDGGQSLGGSTRRGGTSIGPYEEGSGSIRQIKTVRV
jgi:hypothetical protein